MMNCAPTMNSGGVAFGNVSTIWLGQFAPAPTYGRRSLDVSVAVVASAAVTVKTGAAGVAYMVVPFMAGITGGDALLCSEMISSRGVDY
jgi:hypothetical protein